MRQVRTVLGDLPADSLGRVDCHEHLFQVSPLLPGDELDDEAASGGEAAILLASGFDAMIDATPIGLGRDPEAVARVSTATGLTVIATTGIHRDAHYSPDHWLRGLDAPARSRLFIDDLELGMPVSDRPEGAPRSSAPDGQPICAGLIKAGIGYWSISPFERTTLEAIGIAHAATGAPVMVHLEFCTAAHEVLDLLADVGVPSRRVMLAHADRDPDPLLHLELALRGAVLGYDGMARPRTRSDAELVDLVEQMVTNGGGAQIVLGGDVARRTRYLSYGGMPGLGYLGDRFVPRLRDRVGEAAVDAMLTVTPRRFLSR
ncbi:MAG: aryldialkylphosphatase [Burkholderiaceae bacterium]|nr:aryldialkylphosphatase [Microbacteriaceae bacterium]